MLCVGDSSACPLFSWAAACTPEPSKLRPLPQMQPPSLRASSPEMGLVLGILWSWHKLLRYTRMKNKQFYCRANDGYSQGCEFFWLRSRGKHAGVVGRKRTWLLQLVGLLQKRLILWKLKNDNSKIMKLHLNQSRWCQVRISIQRSWFCTTWKGEACAASSPVCCVPEGQQPSLETNLPSPRPTQDPESLALFWGCPQRWR